MYHGTYNWDNPMYRRGHRSRDIPLNMPVTMHVCRESRLTTQETAIAIFDIDQAGAYLNPHRTFRPDTDLLYIDLRISRHRTCDAVHDIVKNNKCNLLRGSPCHICLSIYECRDCYASLDNFKKAVVSKSTVLPHGLVPYNITDMEVKLALIRSITPETHRLGFLFYAAVPPYGLAGQTAVKLVVFKEFADLFDEIVGEPALVIGGDHSEWGLVPPDHTDCMALQGE